MFTILSCIASGGRLFLETGCGNRGHSVTLVAGAIKGMVFLLVALLLVANKSQCEAKVINRINYGVAFEEQQVANAVYDFWSHTFRIQLPKVHSLVPYQITCSNSSRSGIAGTVCQAYNQAFDTVNRVRNNYIETMNRTLTQVINLMQNIDNLQGRGRSR